MVCSTLEPTLGLNFFLVIPYGENLKVPHLLRLARAVNRIGPDPNMTGFWWEGPQFRPRFLSAVDQHFTVSVQYDAYHVPRERQIPGVFFKHSSRTIERSTQSVVQGAFQRSLTFLCHRDYLSRHQEPVSDVTPSKARCTQLTSSDGL